MAMLLRLVSIAVTLQDMFMYGMAKVDQGVVVCGVNDGSARRFSPKRNKTQVLDQIPGFMAARQALAKAKG